MLNDHVHFKTKDGIIFTTRGFYHPKGSVRSVPLYKPTTKRNSLEKNVDEFGDIWLHEQHPEYLKDSKFGKGIFVPIENILETHDPFNLRMADKSLEDVVGERIVKLLLNMGICEQDIGLLGSHLVKTGNLPHDTDWVLRGIDNLKLVKERFNDLLNSIRGRNAPSEQYVKEAILRYEGKYNSEFNNFREMIERRWPTIYVPGNFFGKLRFTYRENEVPITESPLGEEISDTAIKGKVLDDFGTNFMPRSFLFASQGRNIKAVTYFWDFSYCVNEGDEVIIRGNYFPESRIVLICNPKKHGIRIDN